MRIENVFVVSANNLTLQEPWHVSREACGGSGPRFAREVEGRLVEIDMGPWTHWYSASADFALENLKGSGKCLVVGSPVFEALELGKTWDVTYLDVRKPPEGLKWVEGDASAMPFPDESYEAVSSSCVVCHVGLGRYGDSESEDGDYRMFSEIRRVLKVGGLAAVSLPVGNLDVTARFGTCHRIYAMSEVKSMVKKAGLTIEKAAVWDTAFSRWKLSNESLTDLLALPDYLSLLVRR